MTHIDPRERTVSAQQLHITLAGREHVVDAGTTGVTLFMPNGTGGVAPASPVIAVRVNGELRDLAAPPVPLGMKRSVPVVPASATRSRPARVM